MRFCFLALLSIALTRSVSQTTTTTLPPYAPHPDVDNLQPEEYFLQM